MEKGKIYINTPNVAIFDSKNGLVKTFGQVVDVGYSDTTTTTTDTGKVVFTYTEPTVAWAEDLQGHRYSYASESANIVTLLQTNMKSSAKRMSEMENNTLKYPKWVKIGVFLEKHKWLYYLLAHTWGIIMTLIGYVVALILLCHGVKPIKYNGIFYFRYKERWGGVEFGTCFVRDTTSTEHVTKHELGHSYQNCVLGPLFPFLVSIPSACRYWYQVIAQKRGKSFSKDWYDSVWFEGSATEIGTYIANELKKKED